MAITGFYALAVIVVIGVVGPGLQGLISKTRTKNARMSARSTLEPRSAMSAHSSSATTKTK